VTAIENLVGMNKQSRKSRSPVKEEPFEEDLEDEDSYLMK
jgi:hypothetical protein